MAPMITIGGTSVTFADSSLDVEDQIGQRSTARFTVLDVDGVLTFRRGELVEISDGDALTWSGYVDSSQETAPGPSRDTIRTHEVTCVDQQYLAEKRIAARSYDAGTTCGDVVRDLHAQYLAAEGVTLGTVADGATLDAGMVVNYQPVAAALDALVDASDGYVWRIDAAKVLMFAHRSSSAAPWTVEAGTGDVLDSPDPQVTHGNPDYRDTEYVLGGMDVTDPQTETRVGDGNTQAWAMSFPLAEIPTVSLNGTAQTVGIKGVDDEAGYQWGWNKGDAVISQASGATPLTASDTLTVTYRGQFAIVARVDSPAQVEATRAVEGGTGLVEHATEAPAITSRQAAFAAGKAALTTYAVPARTLAFDTRRSGLAAGQWLTVNLPALGLDGVSMLIQSVTCKDAGGGELLWSVTAVDGPAALPWAAMLAPLQPISKADLVSVGNGSILALLVAFSERFTRSHSFAAVVYACHVPAPNLYPSEVLFPC